MQKVLSAFLPRPQATSVNRLFRSSPSSPERPSRGTVAFTCGDATLLPTHRPGAPWKPSPGEREGGGAARLPCPLRLPLGPDSIWLIQNFWMAVEKAEGPKGSSLLGWAE